MEATLNNFRKTCRSRGNFTSGLQKTSHCFELLTLSNLQQTIKHNVQTMFLHVQPKANKLLNWFLKSLIWELFGTNDWKHNFPESIQTHIRRHVQKTTPKGVKKGVHVQQVVFCVIF